MEPWKSWAIVGVVGAGAAYYYSQSGQSKRGGGRVSSIQAEQSQRRTSDSRNDSKDKRKKKGKASDGSDQATSDVAEASSASAQASSTDKAKKRKGKGKQQPSKLAQSSAVEASNDQKAVLEDDEGEDDGMDNKEFAKQLSELKTGTSPKKAETNKENKKTRKQGKSKELPTKATNLANGTAPKPNGVLGSQDLSTASSTTGADADDDLSLPVSPEFGATQNTTPSGVDVSDMLEVPAKGPSVLRLTESVNPQPARQPKSQKAAPEPETKKQRQNRQKNEEKKAMREQAEKERRVLLGKQLRTAREAEGRPAKNGLGVPKAPSTNAWDNSTDSAAGAVAASSISDHAPLLDTFDEDKSFLGGTSSQLNVGANSTSAGNQKGWNSEALSEEEQMRLISEMDSDDTWSTVPKSRKGKKRIDAATSTEANKSTSSGTLNNHLGNGYRAPSSHLHDASSNNESSSIISKTIPHSHKTRTSSNSQTSTNSDDAMSSGHAESPATAAAHTTSPGSEQQQVAPSGIGEEDISTKLANIPVSSCTGESNTMREMKRWQDLTKEELQSFTKAEYDALYLDRFKGTSDHHRARAKRWRAIGNGIKSNGGWDIKTIKQHPDYDPDWPYALISHPLEMWTEDDWQSEDMAAASLKEKAAEEKLEPSASGKTGLEQK